MIKKRILFLIHDLCGGGAERVLVNLANNLDESKFDITIMTLFDIGVNKQYIKSNIHYKTVFRKTFRGNSTIFKLFSPQYLHNQMIKDKYDVEIAYLEGPCARIISGCSDKSTKLISWIHCTMKSKKGFSKSFRNYKEAVNCYNSFDRIVFVSLDSQQSFVKYSNITQNLMVLYNTIETDKIMEMSYDSVDDISKDSISIIGIGKLEKLKGFDRLIRIHKRLKDEGFLVNTYILGQGSEEVELKKLVVKLNLLDSVKLLGYQPNPHKYISKCDLFVCSSFSEGFSTAATEALIVGTPVCTVRVSGMVEMLGENNEYGIITENNEEALYEGIKMLIKDGKLLDYYKQKAFERGKMFSAKKTATAVEDMLMSL